MRPWGRYLRYDYAVADFSAVTDSGLYFLRYGPQSTPAFPIAKDVYERVAPDARRLLPGPSWTTCS
ncbi:MAG: hypothetical protein U0599_16760 [Vicinamibacteria bacterium]